MPIPELAPPGFVIPQTEIDLLDPNGLYYHGKVSKLTNNPDGSILISLKFDHYEEYFQLLSKGLLQRMRPHIQPRQLVRRITEKRLKALNTMKKGDVVMFADIKCVVEMNDPFQARMRLKDMGTKEYEDLTVPEEEAPRSAVKRKSDGNVSKRKSTNTPAPPAPAAPAAPVAPATTAGPSVITRYFHLTNNFLTLGLLGCFLRRGLLRVGGFQRNPPPTAVWY